VPLADAYRRAKDLDRALEVVSIGLERHPDLASAYVVEAWVHQDRGDSSGAAAAWEQVLRLDADNVEALKGLGSLLAAAGRVAQAAPLLDKARSLDPEQPDLRELIQLSPDVDAAVQEATASAVPAPLEAVTPAPPPTLDRTEATLPLPTVPRAPVPDPMPPPVSAAAVEAEAPEEGEDVASELPATRTLAELYARQGLIDRAVEVYQRLVSDRPEDGALRRRLAELRTAAAPSPPPPHPAGVHDEDTEALARALVAPAAAEPSITPFAWGPDEAANEALSDGSGRISDYFRHLLEWEPVERPQGGQASPAIPASVSQLAEPAVETSRVVPIETLAGKPIVPIESLAPGIVVSIASLAPSAVVPVAMLAPEAVPIETLAPRRGPAPSSSRS
jgi:tetratricopeptide (TPR) repeat protein